MTFDLSDPIFSDSERARGYLESLHWPDGAECPHCGSKKVTRVRGRSGRPGLHMCNACRKQFTVTVRTIFDHSKIPLHKWLTAFALLTGDEAGISTHRLSLELGITVRSAWFMRHRIRQTMNDDRSPLSNQGEGGDALGGDSRGGV
ncbi:MAG TPA: IS1595 family transposase [Sphingomicrobium sp.]|nr:IS1595 family transposase [Sphingomicrobium sp.]